ncbi:dienelactone hydrolase family protein [uncultured Ilyobacter sp.]|uniref:dienelactone hydrolase family protein n=1 Tax=uncultured Ilyobacter sp. TaxID=544433 RepID=UPI0029C63381|nr:dienelactone hydrolase family protein [uncultured Ilyobacter sp.]
MKKIKYIMMVIFFMSMAVTSMGASGKMISYKIGNNVYEGYYSINKSPEAPLVLIIHDWDGLTDYEIRRVEMLADLGYSVFAMDLFGAGIRPTEVKDRRQHTGELYADRQKMRSLMLGALEVARLKGGNIHNAVAMGYCFGGAAALEFARSGINLKGFVTFHGGLSTPEGQDYSKTKGEILVLHGTADANISMDDFAKLAVELEDKGISHEMITYSGAPHAFTVFDSPSYRKETDEKSWKRFIEFLDENLNK